MGASAPRCVTDSLKFYIDASLPIAVAHALDHVRNDIEYPGKPGCPIVGPDVKDSEWLRVIGREGWVVIMRDKKVKHRPAERAAIKAHGVKAFMLTAGGNLTRWQTLSLLVRKWDIMTELALVESPPFLCAITNSSPRMIDLG